MYATANSILSLNGGSTFIGNRARVSGGGIWLDNSELLLNGSNYFVECVASYEGGAIFTYAAIASLHGSCTFESNFIYKNWYLNAIQVSFILNLGVLAAATM